MTTAAVLTPRDRHQLGQAAVELRRAPKRLATYSAAAGAAAHAAGLHSGTEALPTAPARRAHVAARSGPRRSSPGGRNDTSSWSAAASLADCARLSGSQHLSMWCFTIGKAICEGGRG